MRPLDRRLLRYARSSRTFLALGGVIAVIDVAAIIAFAACVTLAITRVLAGASAESIGVAALGIAVSAMVRALCAWATEASGARGAARAQSELRLAVLDAVPRLGAAWLERTHSGRLTTLLGHGLDALNDYFARYLPQLIRSAITLPILVVVVFASDWLSGLTLLITLPIIPMFMVLIGVATRAAQRRQWEGINRLATHFLDVIGGLATLKVFGRETRQLSRMGEITDAYRTSTLAVLRVSFLSGFVLELMASLSVALLAVSIGFRLVDGALPLTVGLFVLLLAPEVFLPVRQVGASFHAAAEGVEAAEDAFSVLDVVPPAPDAAPRFAASGELVLSDVTVSHGDIPVLEGLTHRFGRGRLTAVTGESGVGKSTLLRVIAGFTATAGSVRVGGVDVTDAPPDDRPWLAWAPQSPALQAGTVFGNVTLGDDSPDRQLAERCLRLAAAGELDGERMLGSGSTGLSGGQAQRVGIARCYYRALRLGASVIALDEPTSALDHSTEQIVARGLRELAAHGFSVLVVSHRESLLDWADDQLHLEDRAVVRA